MAKTIKATHKESGRKRTFSEATWKLLNDSTKEEWSVQGAKAPKETEKEEAK